jgi:hypothetical protein
LFFGWGWGWNPGPGAYGPDLPGLYMVRCRFIRKQIKVSVVYSPFQGPVPFFKFIILYYFS